MRVMKGVVATLIIGSVFCLSPLQVQANQGRGIAELKKQLIDSRSCVNCDLSGVNLNRENLAGVNLEGANLSRARMHLSTLSQANLRNCNLQGAEFGGADLSGADLRGAKTAGATFAGAYLIGVLVDAGVDLTQVASLPAEETTINNHKGVAAESSAVAEKIADSPAPQFEKTLPSTQENGKEKGFFSTTLEGVRDFFTPTAVDAPPAQTDAVDAQQSQQGVMPERQVAENSKQKEDGAVEALPETASATPPELGFFDNTVQGMKDFFNVEKNVDQQSSVVGQSKNNYGSEVLQKETGEKEPTEGDVTSSVAEEVTSEKEDLPMPVGASASVNSVDDKGLEGGKQAIEDNSGFMDKTFASVKGLFGGTDSRNSQVENNELVSGSLSTEKESIGQGAQDRQGGTQVSPASAPANSSLGGVATQSVAVVNETVSDVTSVSKNVTLLLDTKRCYDCDLKGADLSGKNLEDADLEGADLAGSKLVGVDLENSNLKAADFSGADLRNANLKGADLYKAKLSNADLTGANLEGAFLDDVELTGAVGYHQPAQ